GKSRAMDADWWRKHCLAASERRAGLFDDQTTGYRLINGESDGWPGLVLDRYDTTLVLKLYTASWLPWLGQLMESLSDCFSPSLPPAEGADDAKRQTSIAQAETAHPIRIAPQRLVLRLSRNIQALANKQFPVSEGQLLR